VIQVQISRFNPEKDNKPYMQKFSVPWDNEGTVLGLLKYIYNNMDKTIAFRSNCKNEHCGECGIRIDDKAALACRTIVDKNTVTLKPLAKIPVLKDLAVDLEKINEHLLRSLAMFKEKDHTVPDIKDQNELWFKAGKCNSCFLCMSVCPLCNYEDSLMGGPAIFVGISQYLLRNPSSEKTVEILHQVISQRLLQCTLCGNCQKVCPLEVNPSEIVRSLFSEIKKHGIKVEDNVPLVKAIESKNRLEETSD